MKKRIMQATVGLLVGGAVLSALAGGPEVAPAPLVTPGLYFGLGGALDTYYIKRYYSVQFNNVATGTTTPGSSAQDYLNAIDRQFAPMVQLGYWAPLGNVWLWGLQANYKYLGYGTNNEATLPVIGSALNTANGSGFNFTLANAGAYTTFTNELLLLAYMGIQFDPGFFYCGIGAAMWSLHDFVGPQVQSNITGAFPVNYTYNYAKATNTLWGGAIQAGFNYYLSPTWFLDASYTFAMSGTYTKSQSISYAVFNNDGFSGYGSSYVTLSRKIQLETQELMLSVNKVFEL